jgi:glycosyltransferase involved in cell wall biosynthesis
MKITIVQGAFLPVPPLAGGAVEKLWVDLGAEFARRGLDVTHLSRRWPALPLEGRLDGVLHRRVAGYDYPKSGLLAKWRDFAYSLRCLRRIERSDVVVTNSFFLPLLLALVPRKGLVYVSVHRYPQRQMALYRHADRLQCVSTAVADAVRAQSPSVASLVRVVPNYVNAVLDDTAFDAGWAARRREVLFVGRVHPEKGIDLLLDAFAALPAAARDGWRLKIVGPHATKSGGGGDAYLAALQQRALALGVDAEWTGPIFDREALNEAYRQAAVFVYPSTAARGEAFPLAPLEAMAQGCAAVTSDLKCFDDYVQPGVNAEAFALAVPAPSVTLAAALQPLMADADLRRRRAAEGLTTARRFTLPRIADQFIADFEALRSP